VEELQKDAGQRDDLKAFGDLAAWVVMVAGLWILHAIFWRYVFSSSVPDDRNDLGGGEPRQFLRLYDDMALVHDFKAPLTSERLADLAYPPARRPLLKLWWEAKAQPKVQIDIKHDRIVFTWPPLGPAGNQTVFSPSAPITVERFGQLLTAAVTGDQSKGILHVTPARDDDKTIELAPGAAFGDQGDDKTDAKGHDDAVKAPVDVGTSEAAAFTLYHTVRPRLSVAIGRSGVAPDAKRSDQLSKPGCLLKFVSGRLYRSDPAGDGTSPLLRRLFRPGDVIEIASGGPPGEQRIVEQVPNDTDVVVSSVFTSAIPVAGIAFKRAQSDRSVRVRGTSTVQVPIVAQGIGPDDLQGVALASPFGAQFMPGDIIELILPAPAKPERRRIVAVKDGAMIGAPAAPMNLLQLDAPPPALAAAVPIDRLSDAEADGFPFVADASDVFGDGESVMNDAADLAALLCLGAASRLAPNDTPVTPAGATKTLHRVSQIFRNWNLDRRRVNEWKLMVSGGAESERRGDYRAAEEAAPGDPADAGDVLTDAFVAQRRSAEAIVLERGWLGVFRAWVDMASRSRTDVSSPLVFAPGQPTNLELSRAMAYLLDAREGVA
jgi:hypothetical protein